MAIRIQHRFINRLLPDECVKRIDLIIIGTFNPGLPNKELLTYKELKEFETIELTTKFQKFNLVKNFYDRPQNRFWKIMDYVNNPDFYKDNDYSKKNPKGLKYYKGMDRLEVFTRQLEFCKKRNVLITDIVREMQPNSFAEIYDNFPDVVVEQAESTYNTEGIIEVIEKYKPNKIVVNFRPNKKTIPKVSGQIEKIKESFHGSFYIASSTSGSAGYDYSILIGEWKEYF